MTSVYDLNAASISPLHDYVFNNDLKKPEASRMWFIYHEMYAICKLNILTWQIYQRQALVFLKSLQYCILQLMHLLNTVLK